jgi:long-chain acyl-CoA synthetase
MMEKPWLKSYEPQVPPTLKYPHRPLQDNLAESARKYPGATATIIQNAKLTYAELDSLADRFAAALQGLGVKKGDRVAIYTANCPQFVISYYGAFRAGAIVVAFNPLYAAPEVEHQLIDSGAEVMICMSRFYPNVKSVRARTSLRHVIVTNIKEYFPPLIKVLFTLAKEKHGGDRQDISGDANTHWFQDLLAKAPAKPQPVQVLPEDTAVLLYTGGTTGVPKGAELRHSNMMADAVMCRHWLHDTQEAKEVILTTLPLYHSYGMTTCMNFAVYTAGAMLLIPNPRDYLDIMKNINKHHPTLFPGVPTMYVAFNNFPDIAKYNVKSIRACLSGAAGLPAEVQTKFQELTGARLVEGFGLSESSPVTHANPIYGKNKIGTIGVPWPDTEAKIVDIDTGLTEMPVGEKGELIIRGPQVMKGYWNMPKETAIALRDGWLYTGDIATMDEEGYFKIVDRKKDMIIAGGFNIYPRDVEEALYRHPKVKEAVVAGIPDPYRGETVKAYVILKDGQTATEEEIIEFCKGQVAKYKVPTAVEFRTELPKTIVGKILRRMLVEEEKQKLAAQGK